jgi:ribosomal protein S18 acetylase RimI-like enzyme
MLLKIIDKDDLVFVNNLRNHESTRHRLKNPNLISMEETYKWFEDSKPQWYIMLIDDQKVGYIRTSSDSGETICIGCDVHPDYRRKGYAKSAYLQFMNDLYKRGYLVIWLEVFRDNIPAFNLYKKLGYIEIGSRNINEKEYVLMVHRRTN